MKQYDFPVYGTQCGGLVKFNVKCFIFVEKPCCPGYEIGDVMPDNWGITEMANPKYDCESTDHNYLDGYCGTCSKAVEMVN